ncbi:hypothetical protein J6590_060360 [Homalodisca vitripennis]|nr:hypothetical protein J6590_060360 [Homalodisca vitripennis]
MNLVLQLKWKLLPTYSNSEFLLPTLPSIFMPTDDTNIICNSLPRRRGATGRARAARFHRRLRSARLQIQ